MAASSVFPLLLVLFHIADGLSGYGQLCLSCDKVVLPRDCGHVTRCGVHEKCVVTKYVTSSAVVWYRVGCKTADTCNKPSSHGRRNSVGVTEASLCVHCCNDTALCNQRGCGTTGFGASNSICYNCLQHRTPSSCDDVTVCNQDQACGITQTTFGSDNFYTSGCSPVAQCTHSHSQISMCCNSTLCNDHLNLSLTTTSVTSIKTTVPSTTRAVTKVTARTTKSTAANCASGWIFDVYNNIQYCRHEDVGLVSWAAAKAICERSNSHLPIVESREQLEFIHLQLKDRQPSTFRTVWLDGTDISREGYWMWSSTSGQLVSPLFWTVSQPDNYYGPHSENCLMYGEEYFWGYNDAKCDRLVSVLCQHGVPPTPQLKACPSGNWIEHIDRKYCIVTINYNWYQAKALCSSLGAHLPIVESDSDNNYLRGLVAHGDVWLDATEEFHNGVFKWSSTGTAIQYTNWTPGEPNNYASQPEYCVEFGETYGWKWNDATCYAQRPTINKVICERFKPLASSPLIG
ncbi:macrophage mannose receptor 1-like [Pecten maximus]|uniref:macrophage mannose receptor 1-like n=1 Tax=Pecten maximus TaxID=6579 RepID=UPI00145900D3|nr:macrophage mannose receptor 1-like [Pecten maximus]